MVLGVPNQVPNQGPKPPPKRSKTWVLARVGLGVPNWPELANFRVFGDLAKTGQNLEKPENRPWKGPKLLYQRLINFILRKKEDGKTRPWRENGLFVYTILTLEKGRNLTISGGSNLTSFRGFRGPGSKPPKTPKTGQI
jgi:hypothetical protein